MGLNTITSYSCNTLIIFRDGLDIFKQDSRVKRPRNNENYANFTFQVDSVLIVVYY